MKKAGKNMLSGVAVLIPLLIFALLAMLLTAMGISVYESVVSGSNQNYSRRMAVSYIMNRVRRADRAGKVTVGKFGESEALLLSNTFNDKEYVTKIYFYDGSICELFCPADAEIGENAGTALVPAKAFSITGDSGFITVTVTDESGSANTALIALKGMSE